MPRQLRTPCRFVTSAALLAATTLAAAPGRAFVSLDVKVVTRVQAPGAAPGMILTGIGGAVVNDAGEVAFQGWVEDPTLEIGGSGIFGPDASGAFVPVAFDFEPVPDLPPDTEFRFNQTYFPRLDDAGSVVFQAGLSGPDISHPANSSGIWRWRAESGLERLARAGDPVPAAGPGFALGQIQGGLTLPTNGAGGVHFAGTYADSVQQIGEMALFDIGASGIDPVVTTGMPVPGVPGAVITYLDTGVVSESGDWSFAAWFQGPGVVTDLNDSGSFHWSADSGLSLRIRAGDPAPATEPGVAFAGAGGAYPNAAGRFAYLSRIVGPGVDEASDSVLYGPGAAGSLVLLAREGRSAPGTEPGTVFDDLRSGGSCVVIDAQGRVAFVAALAGTAISEANDVGIWRWDPARSALELLVREGDPAPALPGDTVATLGCPVQNDRGDLAFDAVLAGSDVTSGTDGVVYAIDAAGSWQKVLREGDLVPFGPGDLRPLEAFGFHAGAVTDIPGAGALSNNGQLLLVGYSADGTNALVVATIPEPAFGSGLGAGVVLLAALARNGPGVRR